MFQKLNSMFTWESRDRLSHETELSEKEEDEWILVDLIVDACTRTPPEETSTLEDIVFVDEHPALSFSSGALEQFENTCDSYFSRFEPCPLEESWFVTPPPCFTARELTTIEVETSPLENLLIEHPSMSVYAVHNLSNKQMVSCDSELDTSIHGLDTEQKKVEHRVHCYVAARAVHTHCLDPAKTLHYTKLASKQHLEKPLLNRKSLRRQNLLRGFHSHPVKHRGILVQQPCQRRYNY
ncbi:tumor protein p53-inducible nuclear protein 1 [Hyperolius riggenbachi]|uniref:tumor protein p53-inducible nuclear protein 1 n=1 Tax=Hyperolius riggenbachi TaxID=752182 RepID=UPI0035A35132